MDMYMISYILLGCGVILLFFIVFSLLFNYLRYKSICCDDVSGYDICKKIIDNKKISSVNIVESRNGRVNIYNINRRVIRLSSSNYYNNNCYNLGVSAMLAGMCVLDDSGDNNIRNICKIFSKISYIDISSVIVMIVSYLFSGYYSVVGLIMLGLIFGYQYFRWNISKSGVEIVSDDVRKMKEIDDRVKEGVIGCVRGFDFVYNVSLVITILQICRLFIYMIW